RTRRGAFVAWLLTIARNLARNRLRTTRRAERLRPVPASDARPPAASDADPRIDAAVAALPDDQRAAFVLALVHGLPLETVALVEDVPEGTVKSRLSRAKERLRAALRDVLEKTP
ncbi:MAG TPA: sigma-70 family RNA polymerase sigma factor, partial [Planctomycetota bacterium]|nr:sigma-70 family RNA polymerase sigma factor [Planctomycetota bacterium]